MKLTRKTLWTAAVVPMIAGAAWMQGAMAQTTPGYSTQGANAQNQGAQMQGQQGQSMPGQPQKAGGSQDAREQVQEAAKVVRQMQSDRDLREHMGRAKGIFVVPDYARGALGVGAQGGEGVMLARMANGQWSNPVFYNMGGVSIGAQAGASAGSIAFLLMTDKAVNQFKQQNNFSLNADAGLTIVDWSARGQASAGKGDVIAWSDTEGLFAGVNIGISDINYDADQTRNFYTGADNVTPQRLLAGNVQTTPAAARELKQTLAQTRGSGTMQGRTGTMQPGAAGTTQDERMARADRG